MNNDILLKIEDRVAHIIINRPEKRNALTLSLLEKLEISFLKLSRENSACCILFYGSGEEAFCSGADLTELKKASSLEQRRTFFSSLAKVLIAMQRCKMPIIAKVHGYAMAGGCGLAAACDIVIASDEAKFGLPEVKIGLVPMVVLAPLLRTVGKRALTHLVLTGETVTAYEAQSIGLVTKVYSKKELDSNALKTCQSITKASPIALSAAKHQINTHGSLALEKEVIELANRIAVFSMNEDTDEGINSFLNKTTPEWPSFKKNQKVADKK